MKIALVRDFIDTSFGRQSTLLEKGLKELGHEVISFDKKKTRKEDLPKNFDDYIYYTIFNTPLFWRGIPHYGKNILFDVADTDMIGHLMLFFLRQQPIDEIIVPSEWSKNAFYALNMKIPQPIYIIPHALNPNMFSYPPRDMTHPCVLAVLPHSWDRKGGDIVVDVFQRLVKEGYDFHPVILGTEPSGYVIKNITIIRTPLPDHFFYSVFSGCDILFYPVRGGAFEIPIFEALALGLDVVVTEKGAWSEWVLNKDDVYWIKVSGKVKLWYTNPLHVGFFLNPDKEDAYQKLVTALENWHPEKKKENLMNRAILYRERYNYIGIAKEWEKHLVK